MIEHRADSSREAFERWWAISTQSDAHMFLCPHWNSSRMIVWTDFGAPLPLTSLITFEKSYAAQINKYKHIWNEWERLWLSSIVFQRFPKILTSLFANSHTSHRSQFDRRRKRMHIAYIYFICNNSCDRLFFCIYEPISMFKANQW